MVGLGVCLCECLVYWGLVPEKEAAERCRNVSLYRVTLMNIWRISCSVGGSVGDRKAEGRMGGGRLSCTVLWGNNSDR